MVLMCVSDGGGGDGGVVEACVVCLFCLVNGCDIKSN